MSDKKVKDIDISWLSTLQGIFESGQPDAGQSVATEDVSVGQDVAGESEVDVYLSNPQTLIDQDSQERILGRVRSMFEAPDASIRDVEPSLAVEMVVRKMKTDAEATGRILMSSAEDIFDREENEGRAIEHLGRVMADPYAEFSEVEGLDDLSEAVMVARGMVDYMKGAGVRNLAAVEDKEGRTFLSLVHMEQLFKEDKAGNAMLSHPEVVIGAFIESGAISLISKAVESNAQFFRDMSEAGRALRRGETDPRGTQKRYADIFEEYAKKMGAQRKQDILSSIERTLITYDEKDYKDNFIRERKLQALCFGRHDSRRFVSDRKSVERLSVYVPGESIEQYEITPALGRLHDKLEKEFEAEYDKKSEKIPGFTVLNPSRSRSAYVKQKLYEHFSKNFDEIEGSFAFHNEEFYDEKSNRWSWTQERQDGAVSQAWETYRTVEAPEIIRTLEYVYEEIKPVFRPALGEFERVGSLKELLLAEEKMSRVYEMEENPVEQIISSVAYLRELKAAEELKGTVSGSYLGKVKLYPYADIAADYIINDKIKIGPDSTLKDIRGAYAEVAMGMGAVRERMAADELQFSMGLFATKLMLIAISGAAGAAVVSGFGLGGFAGYFVDASVFNLMDQGLNTVMLDQGPKDMDQFIDTTITNYVVLGAGRASGLVGKLTGYDAGAGARLLAASGDIEGLSVRGLRSVSAALGAARTVPSALTDDALKFSASYASLHFGSVGLAAAGVGEMPESFWNFESFLTLAILHARGKTQERKEPWRKPKIKDVLQRLRPRLSQDDNVCSPRDYQALERFSFNPEQIQAWLKVIPEGTLDKFISLFEMRPELFRNVPASRIIELFGQKMGLQDAQKINSETFELCVDDLAFKKYGKGRTFDFILSIIAGNGVEVIKHFKEFGYEDDVARDITKELLREDFGYDSTDAAILGVDILRLSHDDAPAILQLINGRDRRYSICYIREYESIKEKYGSRLTPDEMSEFVSQRALKAISVATENSLGAIAEEEAFQAITNRIRMFRDVFNVRGVWLDAVDFADIASIRVNNSIHIILSKGRFEAACGLQMTVYEDGEGLATIGFQETDNTIDIVRYQGADIADGKRDELFNKFRSFSGGVDPLPWLAFYTARFLLGGALSSGKRLRSIAGEYVAMTYPHQAHADWIEKFVRTHEDAKTFWQGPPPMVLQYVEEYDAITAQLEEVAGEFERLERPSQSEAKLARIRELSDSRISLTEKLEKIEMVATMFKNGPIRVYDVTAQNLGFKRRSQSPWYHSTNIPGGLRPTIYSRSDQAMFWESISRADRATRNMMVAPEGEYVMAWGPIGFGRTISVSENPFLNEWLPPEALRSRTRLDFGERQYLANAEVIAASIIEHANKVSSPHNPKWRASFDERLDQTVDDYITAKAAPERAERFRRSVHTIVDELMQGEFSLDEAMLRVDPELRAVIEPFVVAEMEAVVRSTEAAKPDLFEGRDVNPFTGEYLTGLNDAPRPDARYRFAREYLRQKSNERRTSLLTDERKRDLVETLKMGGVDIDGSKSLNEQFRDAQGVIGDLFTNPSSPRSRAIIETLDRGDLLFLEMFVSFYGDKREISGKPLDQLLGTVKMAGRMGASSEYGLSMGRENGKWRPKLTRGYTDQVTMTGEVSGLVHNHPHGRVPSREDIRASIRISREIAAISHPWRIVSGGKDFLFRVKLRADGKVDVEVKVAGVGRNIVNRDAIETDIRSEWAEFIGTEIKNLEVSVVPLKVLDAEFNEAMKQYETKVSTGTQIRQFMST